MRGFESQIETLEYKLELQDAEIERLKAESKAYREFSESCTRRAEAEVERLQAQWLEAAPVLYAVDEFAAGRITTVEFLQVVNRDKPKSQAEVVAEFWRELP